MSLTPSQRFLDVHLNVTTLNQSVLITNMKHNHERFKTITALALLVYNYNVLILKVKLANSKKNYMIQGLIIGVKG